MGKHVIVVGGGIAGLAASIILARGGKSVTIFEKRKILGGRAITHLRHGYRFNLGPHAVYRGGPGAAVYRELGVPVRGGVPKLRGIALLEGRRYRLPVAAIPLALTALLSAKEKLAAAALLFRIRRIDPRPFAHMTARQWLDAHVSHPRLRQFIEAMMRVATYSDHADEQSAAVALGQLRIASRGVTYVDEGWQKIVDSLHSNAVTAGVNFVTSSRIVGVVHEGGAVRAVELGGLELEDINDTLSVALPEIPPEGVQGTRLPADTVILAIDPASAAELAGPELSGDWTSLEPVTATCLDVALSKLPVPKTTFAVGIDKPLYYSVHSASAQLTPRGGALIHVMKYRQRPAAMANLELETAGGRKPEVAADERELEGLLDEMQPGWRDVLVHRRFLPSMTVSNALVTPTTKRPSSSTLVRGLYLAGDWVGEEGILSDASLTSARAAARAILTSET